MNIYSASKFFKFAQNYKHPIIILKKSVDDIKKDPTIVDGIYFQSSNDIIQMVTKKTVISEAGWIYNNYSSDVDVLKKWRNTPLKPNIMSLSNENGIIDLLESNIIDESYRLPNNDTLLVHAIRNKFMHLTNMLLESSKCDVSDVTSEYGNTALIRATHSGMIDIIEKLINTGKSMPNHKNIYDHNAIMYAKLNGKMPTIVEKLSTLI